MAAPVVHSLLPVIEMVACVVRRPPPRGRRYRRRDTDAAAEATTPPVARYTGHAASIARLLRLPDGGDERHRPHHERRRDHQVLYSAAEHMRTRALDAGASAFVVKPDVQKLKEALVSFAIA